jgi:hypothetical protein
MVLVTLTLIATAVGMITSQILANRRMIEHRQQELQAAWLARTGIELACTGILTNPDKYAGEALQPIPNSRVEVSVKRGNAPNSFEVTSEAHYPTDDRRGASHSITCQIRRVIAGHTTTVELQVAGKPAS